MSLYRVLFHEPGGLTSPRVVHHCLSASAPFAKCRCPSVPGYITEVWLEAHRPGEAALLAVEKYPGAHVKEVHRGLSDRQYAALLQHLTGYTPRSKIHAMLSHEAGITLQVHRGETQIASAEGDDP